jgi:hypothetical protein
MYHPANNNHVMLATETGIWTTDKINAPDVEWVADNSGLANVRVDMLQLRESDNTIIAATHGRGLAYTTWDLTTAVPERPAEDNLSMYPNPSDGMVNIEFNSKFENVDVVVFSVNGQKVHEEKIADTRDNARINLEHLLPGQYIIRISSNEATYDNKIVIR